jgi:hypothetical protein
MPRNGATQVKLFAQLLLIKNAQFQIAAPVRFCKLNIWRKRHFQKMRIRKLNILRNQYLQKCAMIIMIKIIDHENKMTKSLPV